jgi:hypothetical protein
METMTHCRRAEITAEKWNSFRPHRDLVASDLFLDTMLDREHGRQVQLTVQNPWAIYTGTNPKHDA